MYQDDVANAAPASSREGSKPASMSWKLPALKKSRSSCTPALGLGLVIPESRVYQAMQASLMVFHRF